MMSAPPRERTLAKQSSRKFIQRAERAAARWLPVKPRRIKLEQPIVSFTFDDVPDSAIFNGAPVLDNQGCKGTFYLCGDLCSALFEPWTGYSRSDVDVLRSGGHEIGCHTFSHPDVQTLDRTGLRNEISDNRKWMNEVSTDITMTSFAYPYGSTGIIQKLTLARAFENCRGVVEGLNNGLADFAQLRAFRLYDHLFSEGELKQLISLAVEQKAWLIFYTHDVRDSPSPHGCTPEFLARAVELSLNLGCGVMTVKDACAFIQNSN